MAMQELRKRQKSGEPAQQLHRIDNVRLQEEELPKEEIIRRLRLLGQPVTLFGEVRNGAAIPAGTSVARHIAEARCQLATREQVISASDVSNCCTAGPAAFSCFATHSMLAEHINILQG